MAPGAGGQKTLTLVPGQNIMTTAGDGSNAGKMVIVQGGVS